MNVESKSYCVTKSSPYKQLLVGIVESITHCPFKHDFPPNLPQGVPS
jgi:hypothetical protein